MEHVEVRTRTKLRSRGQVNTVSVENSVFGLNRVRGTQTGVPRSFCSSLYQTSVESVESKRARPYAALLMIVVGLEQAGKRCCAFLLYGLQGLRVESQRLQNGGSNFHGLDRRGHRGRVEAGI